MTAVTNVMARGHLSSITYPRQASVSTLRAKQLHFVQTQPTYPSKVHISCTHS